MKYTNLIWEKGDYRIIKHYWRCYITAKILHDFRIERLEIDYLKTVLFGWLSIFRRFETTVFYKWKPLKEFNSILIFRENDAAEEYINNLKKNVPMDEIVTTYWCWCGNKIKENERCSHNGHTDPAGYCNICKWGKEKINNKY